MIVTFTKSFERSLRKSQSENLVKEVVQTLIDAIEKNAKPEGLGLKKLRDGIWEIRVDLRTRVLFILLPGEVRLLLVGNHNQIKDYLKDG